MLHDLQLTILQGFKYESIESLFLRIIMITNDYTIPLVKVGDVWICKIW